MVCSAATAMRHGFFWHVLRAQPSHEARMTAQHLAGFADAVIFAGDKVAHSLVAVLQAALNVAALPTPLGSHVLSPPLDVCQASLHAQYMFSGNIVFKTHTFHVSSMSKLTDCMMHIISCLNDANRRLGSQASYQKT